MMENDDLYIESCQSTESLLRQLYLTWWSFATEADPLKGAGHGWIIEIKPIKAVAHRVNN